MLATSYHGGPATNNAASRRSSPSNSIRNLYPYSLVPSTRNLLNDALASYSGFSHNKKRFHTEPRKPNSNNSTTTAASGGRNDSKDINVLLIDESNNKKNKSVSSKNNNVIQMPVVMTRRPSKKNREYKPETEPSLVEERGIIGSRPQRTGKFGSIGRTMQREILDYSLQKSASRRTKHLKTIYGVRDFAGKDSRRKQHDTSHESRATRSPENNQQQPLFQPMPSEIYVVKYRGRLNPVEKEELRTIQTVYYMGKKREQPHINQSNQFDDQESDLVVYAHDQICYRFQVLEIIGKGSFGQVFKAFDHKNKEVVALKIIKSKPKYTAQAQIQARLLRMILKNDPSKKSNIVDLKEAMMFRGHMCLTFQMLHQNLYEFLKLHKFSGFSLDLIRRFAIQILHALLFLSRNNIIHCDLKPQNILLKAPNKSGIKVIDLGSSCISNQILYTYIQSRFYRAPEIILGIQYTSAIDIWSFGCILVELYTGYPLFPGENEIEQLGMFVEMLGYPSTNLIKRAKRRKFFDENDQLKAMQSSKGKVFRPHAKTLESVLKCKDKPFLELVKRCLEWDPVKRITAAEALVDKWIVDSLPAEIREQHINLIKNDS